jgi:hypothetical protein
MLAACAGASRTATAEKAAAAPRPKPKAFKVMIWIYLIDVDEYQLAWGLKARFAAKPSVSSALVVDTAPDSLIRALN